MGSGTPNPFILFSLRQAPSWKSEPGGNGFWCTINRKASPHTMSSLPRAPQGQWRGEWGWRRMLERAPSHHWVWMGWVSHEAGLAAAESRGKMVGIQAVWWNSHWVLRGWAWEEAEILTPETKLTRFHRELVKGHSLTGSEQVRSLNKVFTYLLIYFIYLAAPDLSCYTRDLVPRPEVDPQAPCIGNVALSHWITKFSSVRALSHVQLFVTSWIAARQASCPSPAPGVYSNTCPSS